MITLMQSYIHTYVDKDIVVRRLNFSCNLQAKLGDMRSLSESTPSLNVSFVATVAIVS